MVNTRKIIRKEAEVLEFSFKNSVYHVRKFDNVYMLDFRPRVGGGDLYSLLKEEKDMGAFFMELLKKVSDTFELKKHGLVIDSLETLYLTTRQPRQMLQLLRCVAL